MTREARLARIEGLLVASFPFCYPDSLLLAACLALSLPLSSVVKSRVKINGGPIRQRTIDLPITLVSVDTCVNSFERDREPCIDTCYSGNASVGDYDYRPVHCNLQKE